MVKSIGRRAGARKVDELETSLLDAEEADMDSATVNSSEIYVQPSTPSSGSQGDVWIDTDGVE